MKFSWLTCGFVEISSREEAFPAEDYCGFTVWHLVFFKEVKCFETCMHVYCYSDNMFRCQTNYEIQKTEKSTFEDFQTFLFIKSWKVTQHIIFTGSVQCHYTPKQSHHHHHHIIKPYSSTFDGFYNNDCVEFGFYFLSWWENMMITVVSRLINLICA